MSSKLWINGWSAVAVLLALLLAPWTTLAGDGLDKARDLARDGDVGGAVRHINRLLVTDLDVEQRVKARYLKGMLLLGDGDTDAAKAIFERMIVDYPALPEPYNNLAAIHASAGEYERARELLVQVLEKQPKYVLALENLGDIYAKLAANAYERVRGLKPDAEQVGAKLSTLDQLFEPAT